MSSVCVRCKAANTAGTRSYEASMREPKWYGAPRPPKTMRPSAVRCP